MHAWRVLTFQCDAITHPTPKVFYCSTENKSKVLYGYGSEIHDYRHIQCRIRKELINQEFFELKSLNFSRDVSYSISVNDLSEHTTERHVISVWATFLLLTCQMFSTKSVGVVAVPESHTFQCQLQRHPLFRYN